jgi:RecB family endonuclease NucS
VTDEADATDDDAGGAASEDGAADEDGAAGTASEDDEDGTGATLPPVPERAVTGGGVETVVGPSPAAALAVCERALEREAVLTVFGRCSVEYEGRATSSLGPGDRLLVCKPDGSVLVHTDEGQQPVNWQPPGCTIEPALVDADEDGMGAGDDETAGDEDGTAGDEDGTAGDGTAAGKRLRVHSERSTPAEELTVTFERVVQVSAYDAVDPEELALAGTEADLRERVLADPGLVEPGFTPLATERATPAGAVDIYGEDADGRTVVLELKRRRVGPDAVGQLSRYVDALRRDLHEDAEIRGVLVAPSVTDRARQLLAEEGLEFVSLEPLENS